MHVYTQTNGFSYVIVRTRVEPQKHDRVNRLHLRQPNVARNEQAIMLLRWNDEHSGTRCEFVCIRAAMTRECVGAKLQ